MPLPPDVDKRIRKRFEDLIRESELLLKDMITTNEEGDRRRLARGDDWVGLPYAVFPERFQSLKTRTLSLLQMLESNNKSVNHSFDEISRLTNNSVALELLRGHLIGLKDDYNTGMLNSLSRIVEANIAADYMGQAEQLLHVGQLGKFDHVPAAVLTGAVLEDALRRLCNRQNPPIPTIDGKGDPKTLNPLIDELKKANVFHELKAKQLRGWTAIRNAAAHGEFAKFNRQDVELMLKGVQNFLADYL